MFYLNSYYEGYGETYPGTPQTPSEQEQVTRPSAGCIPAPIGGGRCRDTSAAESVLLPRKTQHNSSDNVL